MKRPTLEDVAKLAGVTVTTVSRVINNRGAISEKTRRNVHAAMESLNYHPNELARSLLGNKSHLIGLIFPTTSNPFYGELVFYMERLLSEKGFKSMICNSMGDTEKEKNYLNMLLANQVDGMIVGSHNTEIEAYERVALPVVSIDRILSDKVTVVSSDNYRGGYLATNELYQRGCRKIAHINSVKAVEAPYSYERRQGYLDLLAEKKLEPMVFEVDYQLDYQVKVNIINGILDRHQKIDGIFIADDMTASLTYEIAKQKGITLQIVGYDGSDIVQKFMPHLATIVQPIEEMAKLSVDLLLDEIEGDFSRAGEHFILPVTYLAERKLI